MRPDVVYYNHKKKGDKKMKETWFEIYYSDTGCVIEGEYFFIGTEEEAIAEVRKMEQEFPGVIVWINDSFEVEN